MYLVEKTNQKPPFLIETRVSDNWLLRNPGGFEEKPLRRAAGW